MGVLLVVGLFMVVICRGETYRLRIHLGRINLITIDWLDYI